MMTMQQQVDEWMRATFSDAVCRDPIERSYRFMEESVELAQAAGCSHERALELVEYVYGRPQGDTAKEVGDVLITLAALCNTFDIDMDDQFNHQQCENWKNKDRILAKHIRKPIISALPGADEVGAEK